MRRTMPWNSTMDHCQWCILKGRNCKETTNKLNISNSNTKHDFKNEPATFPTNFWNTFCIVFSKKLLFSSSKTAQQKFPSHFFYIFSIKNTARIGRPHCWGRTVMDEVLGTFSVIMTYFLRMYSSVYKQKRSQKFGHTYTNFTYK